MISRLYTLRLYLTCTDWTKLMMQQVRFFGRLDPTGASPDTASEVSGGDGSAGLLAWKTAMTMVGGSGAGETISQIIFSIN
jgi:hypothetical protein